MQDLGSYCTLLRTTSSQKKCQNDSRMHSASMSVTFLRPRRGLSVLAVWLDAMSRGATAKAACSVEAGRHLCQSFVAPCRANQGHPKGQHWRGVPCCSQMLRALRLLACPIDIVIQACRHRRPCLQSVACKDYATTSGAGQH